MPEKDKQNSQEIGLLIAVVQGQDADMAVKSLADEGFRVTRLPSIGGFIRRKSATLMIGADESEKDRVIDLLNHNCRQRVAFIAVPMENSPLPMPAPTPVTIGGASIFHFEVEHYEEF